MIYYSRNYIIHTHYAYIVRADVIECADAPDYTCILLHVQQKFSFCRLKKHKNLKPQPERKTLRQKRRVALVGGNCQYQISNLFAWRCHPKLCGLDCCWCDRILGPQGWLALFLRNLTIFHKIVFQYQWVHDQETIGKTKTHVKRLFVWTRPVECFPAQSSHVKCSVAFPFQSYHGRREQTAGSPCYRRKNLENLETNCAGL